MMPITDMNEMIARLRTLKRGEVMIYYEGFLMADRGKDLEADLVADEAWKLAQEGRVSLVQRRSAHPHPDGSRGSFEYIAQGRRP